MTNLDPKHSLLLIIEDNPLLVGMYRSAFEGAGFDVIVAHDGNAGLELAKKQKPKAVIVDVLLPGMDGLQVLREIKSDPETKDMKVMILTILDQEEIKKQALDLGAEDFIMKSELRLGEIVNKVKSYLK